MFDAPRGMTGSEISLMMYVAQIAKFGHNVTVFGNFNKSTTINGISYIGFYQAQLRGGEHWDAAVAWIDPRPLSLFTNTVTRIFNQQVNDFHYCPGWEQYVDIITSPSKSHREYLKGHSNFSKIWEVLPNGVNPDDYKPGVKLKKDLIYASSPDRGLHWLLEAFQKIKRAVPETELHVFYSWHYYNEVKHHHNETAFRLRYCFEMIERFKGRGVVHHQSVSRKDLAKVFANARILAYPCDPVSYTEGFSVTTLEAAVSGCVPVICGSDALTEVYNGYVPVIKPPYRDNKDEYVNIVIELLTNDEVYKDWQLKAAKLADIYDWNILGDKLNQLVTQYHN